MRKTGRKRKPAESRRTTLLALLIFGLIFGGVVIFVIRPTTGTPSQAVSAPAGPSEGQVLYETYCAACHGPGGEAGVVPDAPALNADGELWYLSDEELLGMVRHGNDLMPAMGADFTDEQVVALLTYIKGWWTPRQRAIQIGDIGE